MDDGWEKMRQILSRIAVGPSGSKNLTEDEAREALGLCLDRRASDIQIAIFLIAERLKRETDSENVGFLKALEERAHIVTAPCDAVVSLGDPYDGFNRVPHFAPMVAAVLGACGLASVVHGCADMPPKHGLSHRRVLEAYAKGTIDIGDGPESVERAAARAAATGAAYVDLADFHPKLSALTGIRKEIAKRPALSTLEKLILPIRGGSRTHVISGWVHRGYERLICNLMRIMGVDSLLLFKGREGHLDAFAHRPTTLCAFQQGGPTQKRNISPGDLGLSAGETPQWPELSAQSVCDLWKQLLSGQKGPAYACTALTAASILVHAQMADSMENAHRLVDNALESGAAKNSFEAMLETP
jgi:anthranilate phosphoribosyltransferase